jgi:hypothetical protein
MQRIAAVAANVCAYARRLEKRDREASVTTASCGMSTAVFSGVAIRVAISRGLRMRRSLH